jgi:hypothetical protein
MCSLAHGWTYLIKGSNDNVNILLQAGVVVPLLETLLSNYPKVVEAGARALRAILQHPIPNSKIDIIQVFSPLTIRMDMFISFFF